MGRGIHLTLDEWFYHWFEEEDKYKKIAAFFIKLLEVCDKIVLQKGNRHAQKFFDLCEKSSFFPPIQREAAKILMRAIISNSEKIFWVEETTKLNKDIADRLPRKDVYMVEMCLETNDKIFITTDVTLHENIVNLTAELGISVSFAEEFIENYPELNTL